MRAVFIGLLLLMLGRVGILLRVVAVGLVGWRLGIGVVLGIGLLLLVGRATCQPCAHRTQRCGDDKPVVGSGASSHNSAGLGDDGYCRPAATVPQAAVADRSLSCSLAVAKVVAEVAEFARSLHCTEVVGLDCFEGVAGS